MASFENIDISTDHDTPPMIRPLSPPPSASPSLFPPPSSVSFNVDGPTFAYLLAATFFACLISGSTYQWVTDKGLLRKSITARANKYNVLVSAAATASLLQATSCFVNVLLEPSSILLDLFVVITWVVMTHSSLMIVSRKVSLTSNNATKEYKRFIYFNCTMFPLSIFASTAWIGAHHHSSEAFDGIIQALEPVQMVLWGLLEFLLSCFFIIRMRKYRWKVVERKGIIAILLVALCDIGLVLMNLHMGALITMCVRGCVYAFRIRIELDVLSSMVAYIQDKRKSVIYETQKRRAKNWPRASAVLNSKRQGRQSVDSDAPGFEGYDGSSFRSMASTGSSLHSVFHRLPHATDFSNIFKGNFLAEFAAATHTGGSILSNISETIGKKCRDLGSLGRSMTSLGRGKAGCHKKRLSSTIQTQPSVRRSTSSYDIPIQGMEIELSNADIVPRLGEDDLLDHDLEDHGVDPHLSFSLRSEEIQPSLCNESASVSDESECLNFSSSGSDDGSDESGGITQQADKRRRASLGTSSPGSIPTGKSATTNSSIQSQDPKYTDESCVAPFGLFFKIKEPEDFQEDDATPFGIPRISFKSKSEIPPPSPSSRIPRKERISLRRCNSVDDSQLKRIPRSALRCGSFTYTHSRGIAGHPQGRPVKPKELPTLPTHGNISSLRRSASFQSQNLTHLSSINSKSKDELPITDGRRSSLRRCASFGRQNLLPLRHNGRVDSLRQSRLTTIALRDKIRREEIEQNEKILKDLEKLESMNCL